MIEKAGFYTKESGILPETIGKEIKKSPFKAFYCTSHEIEKLFEVKHGQAFCMELSRIFFVAFCQKVRYSWGRNIITLQGGSEKMKKYCKQFIAGFVCGAVLFGTTGAYAAGVLAVPSTQKVVIDGKNAAIEGYNINGNNYFKLRDLGKALDVAVNFDETNHQIRIQSNQTYGWTDPAISVQESSTEAKEQKATIEVADVSVKYDGDGRPLPYTVKAGQVLYGTGNVSKAVNPYAADEYDGYMEVKEALSGTPFPTEPLGVINPKWDESYYDIKMPNPVPCYTHTLPGQKSEFMGMEVVNEKETCTMYVFNAYETQRIIDELYNTFLEHPECYSNGKLNCTVRVGLTGSGLEGNFFYPYRDSCVEQTVGDRNVEYMVYAVDIYADGVFQGTKYCCIQNCAPDHPDVISSDTVIVKYRQTR